ncbi:MAG: hypothetical protein LRZ98_00560 [Candidatus Pacebacteria bacterium]|nr:hypothetical protein [Candidatus Paceibacterota bacterium]
MEFKRSSLRLNQCATRSCAVARDFKSFFTLSFIKENDSTNAVFVYRVVDVDNQNNDTRVEVETKSASNITRNSANFRGTVNEGNNIKV